MCHLIDPASNIAEARLNVIGASNTVFWDSDSVLRWGDSGGLEDLHLTEARARYQNAAEAGNAYAMYSLGEMCENGRGGEQDYVQACVWYKKAANNGNTDAMIALGFMYEQGRGFAQDYAEACAWYKKAADTGDAGGNSRLLNLQSHVRSK